MLKNDKTIPDWGDGREMLQVIGASCQLKWKPAAKNVSEQLVKI